MSGPVSQQVCRQVRDLVHAADAEVSATITRTKLPYFTLEGNICALLGACFYVVFTVFLGFLIFPVAQRCFINCERRFRAAGLMR